MSFFLLLYFTVGQVLDICHCCKVCAKDVGEKCGGIYGIYGKCAEHLTCLLNFPTLYYSIGKCVMNDDSTLLP